MRSIDGGYAFPLPYVSEPASGLLQYPEPGMTLRDYFAAHAPAEPWGWWEPKMPKKPDIPRQFSDLAGYENIVSRWKSDPICDLPGMLKDGGAPENVQLAGEMYQESVERAVSKRSLWDTDRVVQRCVQWPYAYADAMIAERERREG